MNKVRVCRSRDVTDIPLHRQLYESLLLATERDESGGLRADGSARRTRVTLGLHPRVSRSRWGVDSMTRLRATVASYVGVLLYASFIFLGAWRLMYWQALLYVATALVGATLSSLLVPSGSDITAERASKAAAGQDWDKRILGAYFLVSVVTFVIAGLDSGRFGWSGAVPLGVTVAGVVLMLLGQLIFAVAKRQNQFFSSTVRIQHERGHRVCDTGLYQYVRHPGYLGMLIALLAFPLLINSYWAFIPAACGAALLLIRTAIEDRVLTAELPGYREYAARTRWRLIPAVF